MPISIVENRDCMEAMKYFPDKYFELAIVDPPYGINAANMQMGALVNGSKNHGKYDSAAQKIKKGRLNRGAGKLKGISLQTMHSDWDFEKPPKEYFIELMRVSKNQIIWGGNYFELPPTRCVICWDKLQYWDNFSQWEMAWTSFDKPAKMFKYASSGISPDKSTKIHPTQKPKQLYKYLLKTFANSCDKILDTHLGSGSSRIAAYDMGFDFYGYELDKDYFDASCKRFEQYKAQLKLF